MNRLFCGDLLGIDSMRDLFDLFNVSIYISHEINENIEEWYSYQESYKSHKVLRENEDSKGDKYWKLHV